MNIFDFMYICLKENLFTPGFVIVVGIFILLFLAFLFHFPGSIARNFSSIKLNMKNFEIDIKATENKTGFLCFNRKKRPMVLEKIDKRKKETWHFSGPAYYLGKGKDNRYYFIGYFGRGMPPGYKQISVCCETIIGCDWDNTPFWNTAYNQAKNIHGFSCENAPNYDGNGIRNGRNFHGVYACECDISKETSQENQTKGNTSYEHESA